jgi:hypothetical protein
MKKPGSRKYSSPEDKKGIHQWRWMPVSKLLVVVVVA